LMMMTMMTTMIGVLCSRDPPGGCAAAPLRARVRTCHPALSPCAAAHCLYASHILIDSLCASTTHHVALFQVGRLSLSLRGTTHERGHRSAVSGQRSCAQCWRCKPRGRTGLPCCVEPSILARQPVKENNQRPSGRTLPATAAASFRPRRWNVVVRTAKVPPRPSGTNVAVRAAPTPAGVRIPPTRVHPSLRRRSISDGRRNRLGETRPARCASGQEDSRTGGRHCYRASGSGRRRVHDSIPLVAVRTELQRSDHLLGNFFRAARVDAATLPGCRNGRQRAARVGSFSS
jgi:hypothetical protein